MYALAGDTPIFVKNILAAARYRLNFTVYPELQ
jgi:hypothetical protein